MVDTEFYRPEVESTNCSTEELARRKGLSDAVVATGVPARKLRKTAAKVVNITDFQAGRP